MFQSINHSTSSLLLTPTGRLSPVPSISSDSSSDYSLPSHEGTICQPSTETQSRSINTQREEDLRDSFILVPSSDVIRGQSLDSSHPFTFSKTLGSKKLQKSKSAYFVWKSGSVEETAVTQEDDHRQQLKKKLSFAQFLLSRRKTMLRSSSSIKKTVIDSDDADIHPSTRSLPTTSQNPTSQFDLEDLEIEELRQPMLNNSEEQNQRFHLNSSSPLLSSFSKDVQTAFNSIDLQTNPTPIIRKRPSLSESISRLTSTHLHSTVKYKRTPYSEDQKACLGPPLPFRPKRTSSLGDWNVHKNSTLSNPASKTPKNFNLDSDLNLNQSLPILLDTRPSQSLSSIDRPSINLIQERPLSDTTLIEDSLKQTSIHSDLGLRSPFKTQHHYHKFTSINSNSQSNLQEKRLNKSRSTQFFSRYLNLNRHQTSNHQTQTLIQPTSDLHHHQIQTLSLPISVCRFSSFDLNPFNSFNPSTPSPPDSDSIKSSQESLKPTVRFHEPNSLPQLTIPHITKTAGTVPRPTSDQHALPIGSLYSNTFKPSRPPRLRPVTQLSNQSSNHFPTF